jgi:hypothetical protein
MKAGKARMNFTRKNMDQSRCAFAQYTSVCSRAETSSVCPKIVRGSARGGAFLSFSLMRTARGGGSAGFCLATLITILSTREEKSNETALSIPGAVSD